MEVTEKGRYCSSCNKTVIDFRNYSPNELQDFFLSVSSGEKICGHFKETQVQNIVIKISIETLYSRQLSLQQKLLLCMLICFSSTLFSCRDNNGDANKKVEFVILDSTKKIDSATVKVNSKSLKCKVDTCQPKEETGLLGEVAPGYTLEGYKETEGGTLDKPFTYVDTYPEFAGGIDSLKAFIKENLKYPQYEKENKIEGTVFVSFIVDSTGGIQKAKILKSVSNSKNFDSETLRVINSMPKWTPGKQNGKIVNVSFNMPIRFHI
jgi:TonB family protein